MNRCFLVFFISLLSASLYSQNILFKENESGFHIGGYFSSYQGTRIRSVNPAFTVSGRLSYGLYLEEISYDYSSTAALRPYISLLIFKQRENKSSFSLALNLSYQFNFDKNNSEPNLNTFVLGGGLYHKIKAGTNSEVIPGISINWNKTSVEYQGFEASGENITYNLSLTYKYKQAYITPSVTLFDQISVFNLNMGIIFPKK